MKNRKCFAGMIAIAAAAMAVAFAMAACDPEPEAGPSGGLKGSVIIPQDVLFDMPITADISGLTGIKEDDVISYRWETSDKAKGTFTGIPNANGEDYTVKESDPGIERGRYLRVTVTAKNDDREASRSSNAALIHDVPPIIWSVEIDFPQTSVSKGRSYDLKAVVKYGDLSSTGSFQQVSWSVKNSDVGGALNSGTHIGEYSGRLTIASDEEAVSIVVRAVSVYDDLEDDQITLVVGDTKPVYQLDGSIIRNQFEAREAAASENGGRTPAAGYDTGLGAYFVENAKAPSDGAAGRGRYEIYFYLDEWIDATPYKFITYEMTADSYDILNDIDEHYMRFRDGPMQEGSGYSHVQFFGGNYRYLVDRVFDSGPGAPVPLLWATVVVPIGRTASFIHEPQGGVEQYDNIMPKVNVLAFRYITKPSGGKEGKIYFRNLEFHMTEPK